MFRLDRLIYRKNRGHVLTFNGYYCYYFLIGLFDIEIYDSIIMFIPTQARYIELSLSTKLIALCICVMVYTKHTYITQTHVGRARVKHTQLNVIFKTF